MALPSIPPSVPGKPFARVNRRLVVAGDSFAGYCNFPLSVSAITCTAGVVTVTAAGHGGYTGSKISVIGASDARARVHQSVITYISSSQFSFLAPGLPDGTVTNDGKTIQVLMLDAQVDSGLVSQLQRRTGGAFNFVSNSGLNGRTSSEVLPYLAARMAAFRPELVYWECYYNDCNEGVPTATTIANVQAMIALAGNALVLVSSAWPFAAGAAANTAANLQRMVDYNRQLEALCAQYGNVIYIDNYSQFVNPATGLIADTADLFADGIHPSWRGRYKSTTTVIAALAARYSGRSFVASGTDNIATNAANLNIARFMPKGVTTGGGLGSGVTGAVATTDGVTGAAAAGTAGAALGFTASGSSITTAVAWIKTESDGFVRQSVQYSVFSGTSGQGRISQSLTTADVAPGGVVSFSFKGSVGTQCAASAKTPDGQSITAITAQLVVTIDGLTFTIYEAKAGSSAVANAQGVDVVDFAFVLDNVQIPSGTTITLVRLDLIANCSSLTSNFQIDMGRVRVLKAS